MENRADILISMRENQSKWAVPNICHYLGPYYQLGYDVTTLEDLCYSSNLIYVRPIDPDDPQLLLDLTVLQNIVQHNSASPKKLKAMIMLHGLLFNKLTLIINPNWLDTWNSLKTVLLPYSSIIESFYIQDEPLQWYFSFHYLDDGGWSYAPIVNSLNLISSQIKSDFPGTKTCFCESSAPFERNDFVNVSNVDRIGIAAYSMFGADHISIYNQLSSKITGTQKLMYVPRIHHFRYVDPPDYINPTEDEMVDSLRSINTFMSENGKFDCIMFYLFVSTMTYLGVPHRQTRKINNFLSSQFLSNIIPTF